jgi:mannose-1-phosphate guanylyltransferase
MKEEPQADVLLLCAGFGTRLRPLTESTPKPLLQVGGRALIDHNLRMIARSGFRRVFVNVHYLAEQIIEYVGDGSRWGLEAKCVYEPVILDTGGAVRNIEKFLEHEFLITVNSDVLLGLDFSLRAVLDAHISHHSQPMVTMVLRHDADARSYGEIGIDSAGRVVRFLGSEFGLGPSVDCLMFLGVEVLSRGAFAFMPPAGEVFSITRQTLQKIIELRGFIASWIYDGFWSDIGTPERLLKASKAWEASFGIS